MINEIRSQNSKLSFEDRILKLLDDDKVKAPVISAEDASETRFVKWVVDGDKIVYDVLYISELGREHEDAVSEVGLNTLISACTAHEKQTLLLLFLKPYSKRLAWRR